MTETKQVQAPDTAAQAGEVTRLLRRAEGGDAQALGHAFSSIYDDLKRCARRQLRNQRDGLTTVSLVNETYLRISADPGFRPQDRAQLIGLTSRAMREVLVDQYRAMATVKRGGGKRAVTLSEEIVGDERDAVEALALDRALARLEAVDRRLAQVVEWRYFGGYSESEIAQALAVTERTVQRDWRKARAYLLLALSGASDDPESGPQSAD